MPSISSSTACITALQQAGQSLAQALQVWAANASARLSLAILQRDRGKLRAAASEMGFGAVAHSIFVALDKNASGSVSYRELTDKLLQSVPADTATKRLITAMLWSWDTGTAAESKATLNTRGWHLKGDDAPLTPSDPPLTPP